MALRIEATCPDDSVEGMMSAASQEIVHCEVCGNKSLRADLNLGSHPMCDDLVRIGDHRVCKTYPIEILFCERCITAHQRFQLPKRKLFPPSYHYRSANTNDVMMGMRNLVDATEQLVGNLLGKKVVDIGCNDGSLLAIFAERGASTFGIEPTGAAKDARQRGHRVIEDFFGENLARSFVEEFGRPDVISFTNVFAHIEDLAHLIQSLKVLSGSDTTIVVENHYFGAILDKNQFDTFYHEHPRTYSYTSFAFIADALGMRIAKVEFPQRYGGNIRVFMTGRTGAAHDRWNELWILEQQFGARLRQLAANIERWKARKSIQLRATFERHGKLAAKAFPGRAAIPIKMLGLDERMISAVYEKPGSSKIGHYIPGTRIPIVSDNEFLPGSGPLLNLAWHVADEIRTYMQERGYVGGMLDIISREDFAESQS
ncbi:SAM-dependent methyltransferase [Bradyrhizobium sp. S3.12.5]|uniref:class I SAM-dependent methyltransferase n=1 Tax=Bradyrhizobium sp. S3.12.5 TaxID=3156386 RepID=UPI00339081A7